MNYILKVSLNKYFQVITLECTCFAHQKIPERCQEPPASSQVEPGNPG